VDTPVLQDLTQYHSDHLHGDCSYGPPLASRIISTAAAGIMDRRWRPKLITRIARAYPGHYGEIWGFKHAIETIQPMTICGELAVKF
jgi:hypothetical protein